MGFSSIGILANYAPLDEMEQAVGTMNLDALAFRAMIPAKFQAMLASYRRHQADLAESDTENSKSRTADKYAHTMLRASEIQQQIDSNRLQLSVGGKAIDIEQGELRQIMEQRLERLKERRALMVEGGASDGDIAALDDLIADYEPLIDDLKDSKADEATIDAIEDLLEKDPELARQLEADQDYAAEQSMSAGNVATSFSAEHFEEGGMVAPSLTAAFAQGGSITPTSDVPENAPQPDDSGQKLNNTLESFGF